MKKISDSTIQRLSRYYRTLSELIEKDITTISSREIADINSIASAQVRKDLSFFGTFGKRGLGYNTVQLKNQISKILGLQKQWNVAMVGMGNIGRALIHYDEFKKQGFNIIALFDNDEKKCGKLENNIVITHINDAKKVVKNKQIEIIIIAVPAKVAQDLVDKFVDYGIKAFLNFAPTSIKTPEKVLVKNENMSIELEALSYFLTNK